MVDMVAADDKSLDCPVGWCDRGSDGRCMIFANNQHDWHCMLGAGQEPPKGLKKWLYVGRWYYSFPPPPDAYLGGSNVSCQVVVGEDHFDLCSLQSVAPSLERCVDGDDAASGLPSKENCYQLAMLRELPHPCGDLPAPAIVASGRVGSKARDDGACRVLGSLRDTTLSPLEGMGGTPGFQLRYGFGDTCRPGSDSKMFTIVEVRCDPKRQQPVLTSIEPHLPACAATFSVAAAAGCPLPGGIGAAKGRAYGVVAGSRLSEQLLLPASIHEDRIVDGGSSGAVRLLALAALALVAGLLCRARRQKMQHMQMRDPSL
eukprot:gnl/TRDRNA2_/TRDRNA2_139870_c0_seq2.p1 gnl/TRDRNA2_/TRDRNA2_139870_c0~~gnl/TRDRNA2_/TRDRNA2_139870_c0_seq2.p1  ORF type:complete len:316 (+),score=49.44 gnl/TRDRNA2_/TRDRNA2_139870_c0_seq2:53-1000(+)